MRRSGQVVQSLRHVVNESEVLPQSGDLQGTVSGRELHTNRRSPSCRDASSFASISTDSPADPRKLHTIKIYHHWPGGAQLCGQKRGQIRGGEGVNFTRHGDHTCVGAVLGHLQSHNLRLASHRRKIQPNSQPPYPAGSP